MAGNMRRYLRHLMPLVLVFMMLSAVSATQMAFAEDAVVKDPDESYEGKTVILSTNDVHGALGKAKDSIGGYQYAAGLKEELEKRGADVLLADCGDYSQGSAYVGESKGASAIDMMNLSGYDYATLGNHEFDYGTDTFNKNIKKAEFKVLCADILYKDTKEPVYQPSDLYKDDDSDLKIGFVGMDTPEAQTKSIPTNFTDIECAVGEDFYKCAQDEVDSLRAEGADLVFCIAHLGVSDESSPYRSTDLYAKTTGFDMILDGHSHTVMTEGPDHEPIMSTGSRFEYIGVTVIDEQTEKIEDHFLYKVTEDGPSDDKVKAAADKYIADVDAAYSQVIAESKVFLNGTREEDQPGVRNSETNLGDLITDGLLWYVRKQGADLGVPDENIVAVENGGGIRSSIDVGDVTREDIFNVMPFGNTVVAITVKGQELLEALEASTYTLPENCAGFPHVSGIEYEVDTTKEYDAQPEPYPASTFYGPASINRVTIKNINGKPFDPDAEYIVLANNFIAQGGDTFYAFKNASSQFDTGISDEYAVRDYITDYLDGVIEAPYDKPQGRVKIITDASSDTAAAAAEPETGSSSLAVDGIWGKKTITVTQHILGCREDGIMGEETIRAIQKKIGAEADGFWGTGTSEAMQKFLGITADGVRGPETVRAWQEWCNSQS